MHKAPDNTPELALVGSICAHGNDALAKALERFSPDQMRDVRAQAAYRTMASMDERGMQITSNSLAYELRKSDWGREIPDIPSFIAECDAVQVSVDIHLQDVIDGRKREKLAEAAAALQMASMDGRRNPDDALSQAEGIILGEHMGSIKLRTAKDALDGLVSYIQARVDMGGRLGGYRSGIAGLDKLTDGYQPGEMAVVAARPSIGKTAAMMRTVQAACLEDKVPTLVVTLEMSVTSLMRRLLSAQCDMASNDIRAGLLTRSDMERITVFFAKFKECPIHFMELLGGIDSKTLCATIRRKVKQHGIKLVLVDYLQKINCGSKKERRTEALAEVSGDLKACAAQAGLALVCLAQLNRGAEDSERPPRLSDLAECGRIEQDADLVVAVHRDRYNAEVQPYWLVLKQRDGECGAVPVQFEGRYCRFSDKEMTA